MNMEKLRAINELAKPIMALLEAEAPYIKVLIDDNEVRTIRIEGSVKRKQPMVESKREHVTEKNSNEYKLLAEVICKYCTEKQLTQKDVMSAVSIALNKFCNDATI